MLHIVGFPHSDTCGSRLICSSPQLFAAYRVLLRLLMPRHSPCTLSSLNFMSYRKSFSFVRSVCVNLLTLSYQYCYCTPLLLRCSNCYPSCFHEILILLDLLFLHLCFIQFSMYNSWRFLVLVGSSGLEPPTSRLSGARSSLLSYEPVSRSYLFLLPLVEMKRFELLTPCLQGRCSPNWATPPGLFRVRTLKIEQRNSSYFC